MNVINEESSRGHPPPSNSYGYASIQRQPQQPQSQPRSHQSISTWRDKLRTGYESSSPPSSSTGASSSSGHRPHVEPGHGDQEESDDGSYESDWEREVSERGEVFYVVAGEQQQQTQEIQQQQQNQPVQYNYLCAVRIQ